METENQQLTKKETLIALGIDAKTLARWVRMGTFPGPAVIENGVKYWTTRQVERFNDWQG